MLRFRPVFVRPFGRRPDELSNRPHLSTPKTAESAPSPLIVHGSYYIMTQKTPLSFHTNTTR